MKYFTLFILSSFMSVATLAQDWPNLTHFQNENAKLGAPAKNEKRVVFMGNSITEGWIKADPDFFASNDFINRGIGGQTTPQMLLRFRQDVIDLRPAAVVILAGINDIAGNTGPSTLKMIEDNISSMAELASASGIKVILCSLLPSNRIPWRNNEDPSAKVIQLNNWIEKYCHDHHYTFVNYFKPLADAQNGLPVKYSGDGVHPTLEGYKIMEEVVSPAILQVKKK